MLTDWGVDVVVVVTMICYAVVGYRRGLFVSALSLGGFVAGSFASLLVVPQLAANVEPGLQRALAVFATVLLSGVLGWFIGSLLGSAVRDRVTYEPVRVVDQVLGAAAGLVAVAVVLWFLGGALRAAPSPAVAHAVGESQVLGSVDRLMPPALDSLATELRSSIAGGDFPRVFSDAAEEILPIGAPGDVVLSRRQLVTAAGSIVKVTGNAEACGRGQEGSGAVVAAERVVTNAHVVSGVEHPQVQVAGVGRQYRATVVAFDPRRDVAVLAVPGLKAPPLARGRELDRGGAAVVAGFPRNGPFTASPARVRQVVQARGEDIYGGPGVDREVYSLRGIVEPGNSGGPVLDAAGAMVGLVFARSASDAETGYALTLSEIAPVVADGVSATEAVENSGCAVG